MSEVFATLGLLLLVLQDRSAEDLIRALRSDQVEKRNRAALEVKKKGEGAIPALEEAEGDPNVDLWVDVQTRLPRQIQASTRGKGQNLPHFWDRCDDGVLNDDIPDEKFKIPEPKKK